MWHETKRDRKQIIGPRVLFWGLLCITFNPSAWCDCFNTAHIKLRSQDCLDVPVSCHDDFHERPWHPAPGRTCWLRCPSVFTSQSEPEGAARCLNLLWHLRLTLLSHKDLRFLWQMSQHKTWAKDSVICHQAKSASHLKDGSVRHLLLILLCL